MDKLSTEKIKGFWLKYEQKIVLTVAFCLIAAISFEFGVFQGQKWQQKPLIIEKAVSVPPETQNAQNEAPASSATPPLAATLQVPAAIPNASVQNTASSSTGVTGCAFVGSKNSNKFYLPTCSYAKRVKPENLVCFKTAEEATGQGRTQSICK